MSETRPTRDKRCTHCEEYKTSAEFTAHKHTLDGLQSWCKVCTLGAGARYREVHRETINTKRRYTRKAHDKH